LTIRHSPILPAAIHLRFVILAGTWMPRIREHNEFDFVSMRGISARTFELFGFLTGRQKKKRNTFSRQFYTG